MSSQKWIQTYTDQKFEIECPEDYNFTIKEIAKVLSRIPRFSGHTKFFYSVAQHSCEVYQQILDYVKQRETTEHSGFKYLIKAALLHDAHEAYSGFGDVCSPAKPFASQLKGIEEHIDRAISAHFGFSAGFFSSSIVKEADIRMCITEARDLLGPKPEAWAIEGEFDPYEQRIFAMSSKQAEKWFIFCATGAGLL